MGEQMIKVEIGLNAKGRPCRMFIVLDGYDKAVKRQTDGKQSIHLSCRGAYQLVRQLLNASATILWGEDD